MVAGINSSAAELEKGTNENVRVFSYDDNSCAGYSPFT